MEKIFFLKQKLHLENLPGSVVHAESLAYLLTSIYCTQTQFLSDYFTKHLIKNKISSLNTCEESDLSSWFFIKSNMLH